MKLLLLVGLILLLSAPALANNRNRFPKRRQGTGGPGHGLVLPDVN